MVTEVAHEDKVIDMEAVAHQRNAPPALLTGATPEEVLGRAQRAAVALKHVIELKTKPVRFNNEVYLEFEDWQTCANFYGITARVVLVEFSEYGEIKGFTAVAEAIDREGRVLSRAEASCLNDEEKWRSRPKYEWKDELDKDGKKVWMPEKGKPGDAGYKKGFYKSTRERTGDEPVPLFQLKSMAQTRACAKVLRNILSWIVVLAGYQPTPAEDLDRDPEPENGHAPATTEPSGVKAPEKNGEEKDEKHVSYSVHLVAAMPPSPCANGGTKWTFQTEKGAWVHAFDKDLGETLTAGVQKDGRGRLFTGIGKLNKYGLDVVAIDPPEGK